MKKISKILTCFLIPFLFTSCWFFDNANENYITEDSSYYLFEDFETMTEVLLPMINDTFTDFHYGTKKFQSKYEKYKGNVDLHSESFQKLADYQEQGPYEYCIYTDRSKTFTSGEKNISISGTFFLITDYSEKVSTIFYKN